MCSSLLITDSFQNDITQMPLLFGRAARVDADLSMDERLAMAADAIKVGGIGTHTNMACLEEPGRRGRFVDRIKHRRYLSIAG